MARETDMTGSTLSSPDGAAQAAAPVVRRQGIPLDWERQSASDDSADDPTNARHSRDGRLTAFVTSAVLHTLLLVVLALFSYTGHGRGGNSLTGRQGEPTQTVTLSAIEPQDQPTDQEAALAPQPVHVQLAPNVTTLRSPLRVASTTAELAPGVLAALSPGGDSAEPSPLIRLPGGGIAGRTPEGRAKWGKKYGATAASERAVEEALRWLAEHQRPNGSWSFDLELAPCGGRCRHSAKSKDSPTPSTAATGLAILAFLGAGHTHLEGPYTETVRRGIYYLRDVHAETEAGYDWQQGSMYGHGIALFALAEALAMTPEGDRRDSDLVNMVHRGAWFSVIAQHRSGSWGYVPGSPGDTTVSGWQILSLLAAKRGGAPMGTYTFRDAKEFLLSTSEDREYSFGYTGPPGEPTTTAIGLTLMLYLGESPAYTPFYDALTRLAERGPQLTNVYHDYYGTLALHHSRHPGWDQWNDQLRDFLVAKQSTTGHERGSWHFKDKWGDVGGRLYTTAMCTMMLEIYYRYQPMYAEIEDFPL